MGFLIAIVVGGLAGWVASLILGENARFGVFANIVIGLVGAFVGNFLVGLLGGPQVDLAKPTIVGFIVAVLGAIVSLLAVNAIFRNRR